MKGTGKKDEFGYEIMTLILVGKNTVADLTADELKFYNMFNHVITDTSSTSHTTLVYNDDRTDGGNWITGNFDVGDMDKLDENSIALSGNALIAHEFNEQMDKDKLGLKPGEGKKDQDYLNSHDNAINHEDSVLASGITLFGENLYINGKKYSKIYEDLNTGNWIGINLTTVYEGFDGQSAHKFTPTQDIIKPNIPNIPNKPGSFKVYKQYPGKAEIIPPRHLNK